jgi:hypothetical protein
LIFDAHYGYDVNIAVSNQPAQDLNFGWTVMKIPGLDTSSLPKYKALQQGGMPSITLDGFSPSLPLGSVSRFQPQDYWDPERNYDANLTWVKGNHNFRFGFDSDIQNSKESQYQPASGSFISGAGGFHFAQQTTEGCSKTTGSSCGTATKWLSTTLSFLLATPRRQDLPMDFLTLTKHFAGYAHDQWQVSIQSTVNAESASTLPGPDARVRAGYSTKGPTTRAICGVGNTPKSCNISTRIMNLLRGWAFCLPPGRSDRIRAGFGISTDPKVNIFGLGTAGSTFPY